MSSNEGRETVFGKQRHYLKHVQHCMWIVQRAAHYSKIIWQIKLFIMQLQRTICDQKVGSKLHFVWNQKQSAILPQNAPFCTQSAHVRHQSNLTPHFQILSAVYDCAFEFLNRCTKSWQHVLSPMTGHTTAITAVIVHCITEQTAHRRWWSADRTTIWTI